MSTEEEGIDYFWWISKTSTSSHILLNTITWSVILLYLLPKSDIEFLQSLFLIFASYQWIWPIIEKYTHRWILHDPRCFFHQIHHEHPEFVDYLMLPLYFTVPFGIGLRLLAFIFTFWSSFQTNAICVGLILGYATMEIEHYFFHTRDPGEVANFSWDTISRYFFELQNQHLNHHKDGENEIIKSFQISSLEKY